MMRAKKEAKAGFGERLIAEVRAIAKKADLDNDRAFAVWFARVFFDLSETDSIDATSYDGANDKGVDLFWVDDDQERIVVGQFKFSETLSLGAREAHFSRLEASLKWLADPEAVRKEGQSGLADAAEEHVQAIHRGFRTELWYVYAGPRSKNLDKEIRVFNQNRSNYERDISAVHYPIDLIEATYKEIQGTTAYVPEATLKVTGGSRIETSGSFGSAVVTVLPASELVRLYEEHSDKLFDGNVRLSLGRRKGSVNSGIMDTLQDAQERGNFWAYNNGLTVVCDSVKPTKEGLKITNFSIVNGCQTTTMLAESGSDLSDVQVLVRFIASPTNIVDNIILFNNSQNPVRPWDLASRFRTQRRLVASFKSLPRSIKYWTRRGKKPRALANPTNKPTVLPFEKAGQYLAAYNGKPVLAWKHKGVVFQNEHEAVFRPDISELEVLFAYICGSVCDDLIPNVIRKRDSSTGAILKKGGALFSLAAMGVVLRRRNGATFINQLDQNRIESSRTLEKLEKYAQFSCGSYVKAVQNLLQTSPGELATKVRALDYFEDVRPRVEADYDTYALSRTWLDDALPRL